MCAERKSAAKSDQNPEPKTADEIEKEYWPKYQEYLSKVEKLDNVHKFDGSNFDMLLTKVMKLVKSKLGLSSDE